MILETLHAVKHQRHLELLVGDCMRRYARAIAERAAQFGMDVDRDVVWVQGCPVDEAELQQALGRLERALPEPGSRGGPLPPVPRLGRALP